MSAPQLLSKDIHIGAVTATTTYYAALGGAGGEYLLDSAVLMPDAAFTADASNFFLIAIMQGASTIGSITLASQTLAAGTAVEFSLTKDENAEFDGDDPISVVLTETGTATMVASRVEMVFRKVRS
jgi:hypothetical protein